MNDLILALLAVSTILSVLEWIGLLPEFISKRINRNRIRETVAVLGTMGIKPDKYERVNVAKSIPIHVNANNMQESLNKHLEKCVIKAKVGVGNTEQVEVDNYLDVMSITTDSKRAEQLARHLTSYWKQLLEKNDSAIKTPQFNLVVTPKGGSPILGYEFAKIMNVPFALHSSEGKKFYSSDPKFKFKAMFDSFYEPSEGDVALIVDDSATGGRKVLDAICSLQENRIHVSDCLVLFEPTVKGVRQRLSEQGVNLHTITKR